MNFLSYIFLWAFMPLGLLLYWLFPRTKRAYLLLALNIVFYGYYSRRFLLLLLVCVLLAWAGALFIERHRASHLLAKAALAGTLGAGFTLLFVFKYLNFVINGLNAALRAVHMGALPLVELALPLGISFYMFTACAYVLDVYFDRLPAEKNPARLAAFVTFFPTITSGPIQRAPGWFRQLDAQTALRFSRLKKAALMFLWGAFLKMVLADRLAMFVDQVYANVADHHGFILLLAVFGYSIQIYADFSGYSLMALGVACAFGFDLPENFRQPYLESSIASFWRCWHISLTSWFRDYLYIPLGGNRKGQVRKYINIFIVFLVSGLWHGEHVTFLVWGGVHGLYQIVGGLTRKKRDALYKKLNIDCKSFSFRLGQRVVVFVLVSVAWVFFRAQSLRQAMAVLSGALRLDNPWVLFDGTLEAMGLAGREGAILFFSLMTLLLVSLVQRSKRGFAWLEKQGGLFQGLLYGGLLVAILVYGIYGPDYVPSAFIYAGF